SVFMDVTDIRPGDDFVTTLDSALSSSRVVLAVIGPDWLTCASADGRRRLDDPGDHLRLEIAHALRAGVRVIPVLVRGTRMPTEPDLPADSKARARRQAQEVSASRWSYDPDQLVRTIDAALGRHAAQAPPRAHTADASAGAKVPLAARLGQFRTVATAAVFVVLMVLAAYSRWFGRAVPADDGKSGTSAGGTKSGRGGDPGTSSQRRQPSTPPARLPPSGEARAGPIVFKVLGGLVSRDSDGPHTLRLYVRMTNVAGGYGSNVSFHSFRLLVGDQAVAPPATPLLTIYSANAAA